MEILINIVDRNYEQIKEFCDFNNIKIEDYIVQCTEDDFFTRKYGDLNEKITKSRENTEKANKFEIIDKTKNAVVNSEISELYENSEKPLNGISEDSVDVDSNTKANEVQINTGQMIIKREDTVNTVDKELQKAQKRIKRTLKAK